MSDEMSVISYLSSIRNINKLAKSASLESLSEIVEKLTAAYNDKVDEYKQYDSKVAEKNEARLKAIEFLEAANLPVPSELREQITVDDLLGIETKAKRKEKRAGSSLPKKAKYAIKSEGGEWKTYGGRGREALWVAEALSNGETRESLEKYAQEYNLENDLI